MVQAGLPVQSITTDSYAPTPPGQRVLRGALLARGARLLGQPYRTQSAAGRSKVTTVPQPSVLSTAMSPRWSATTRAQIASPSPAPTRAP